MLRKIFASGIAMSTLTVTFSQDSSETSPLSITGAADVYYRYDFARTKSNNLTSFTGSHNTFELGMVTTKLTYKTSKVELVADLGLGKRAQEFSYNDEGILAAVKQLYMSYSPGSWLKLTAGSWATHIGYEVVDAQSNRNYSMSYMFTNGPFFHTGLKADLTFGSSSFMVGITNPTDFKYVPDGFINKKTVIAQYGLATSDEFKAYLNYAGGQGIDTTEFSQVDLVLTSKLNDKFSVAYNGTWNNTHRYLGDRKFDSYKSWWGSAVYLNFDPKENLGFTFRQEYFNDDNSLKVYSAQPLGGSVLSSTLSANIRLDNFIIIPEVRFDHASRSIFTDKKNNSTDKAVSVLCAAVYQFSL